MIARYNVGKYFEPTEQTLNKNDAKNGVSISPRFTAARRCHWQAQARGLKMDYRPFH